MPVNMHPPLLLLVTLAAPDGMSLGSSSGLRDSGGSRLEVLNDTIGDVLKLVIGVRNAVVILTTITSRGSGGSGGSSSGDGSSDRLGRGSRSGSSDEGGRNRGLVLIIVNNRGSNSIDGRALISHIGTLHDTRNLDAGIDGDIAPDLALVRRAGELLVGARLLQLLALLLLPHLAALQARGRRRGEARVALLPAVLGRGPAPVLGGVRGHLDAAPVGVLEDALLGHGAGVVGRHGEGGLDVGTSTTGGRAEELGAGDLVVDGRRRHLVHVEPEALVLRVHVAGDGDFLVGGDGEGAGGRALQVDLSAVDVELGLDDPAIALAGDVVHGGHLGAEEVGARGQTLGNLDAEQAVVLDDLLDGPLLARIVVAVVPDLEPAGAAGVLVKVGDGLGVDGDRTLV